jgi:hypothetical protein
MCIPGRRGSSRIISEWRPSSDSSSPFVIEIGIAPSFTSRLEDAAALDGDLSALDGDLRGGNGIDEVDGSVVRDACCAASLVAGVEREILWG